MGHQMQIGEVAERTGLSLRTIRYYGEVGLVVPSSRTEGGFRLYTDDDVARLELVKMMKPLEFSLEEMREVIDALDELDADPSPARRTELHDQLRAVREAAAARREQLTARIAVAESFIDQLGGRLGG